MSADDAAPGIGRPSRHDAIRGTPSRGGGEVTRNVISLDRIRALLASPRSSPEPSALEAARDPAAQHIQQETVE